MAKVNLNNLRETLTTIESLNGYTLEWVTSQRNRGKGYISIYANDNYLGF